MRISFSWCSYIEIEGYKDFKNEFKIDLKEDEDLKDEFKGIPKHTYTTYPI